MLSLSNTSRHFFVIKVFKMPLLYVSAFVILFLSLSVSQSHLNDSSKEITLAMVKPDGVVDNHTGAVQKVIMESGFIIIRQITVQLVEESAARFYAEHSSRSFFSSLIKYITSGPVLAMVLEKENAISDWQYLIEPTDARIRAMCGLDSEKNFVHGSDSKQSAQKEISFFFGDKLSDEVIEDGEL